MADGLLALQPLDGTINRLLERLYLTLDADGRMDVDRWCVKATQIHTARRHTERVFAKLGVRNRSQVVMRLGEHAGRREPA